MFRFIRKLLRLIFREKGVYYIGSGEILPPPLTPEKERELVLNITDEENRKMREYDEKYSMLKKKKEKSSYSVKKKH